MPKNVKGWNPLGFITLWGDPFETLKKLTMLLEDFEAENIPMVEYNNSASFALKH